MPKVKMTNAEFMAIALPMILNGSPTLKEIGAATGYSEGGVYYKLRTQNIKRKSRFVMEQTLVEALHDE